MYLKDFKNELREVVKQLQTMGRKGSDNLGDNTSNTLGTAIVLGLRQCVSAASSADVCAKKFLRSLQSSQGTSEIISKFCHRCHFKPVSRCSYFSYSEPCGMLGVNFGSSFSISSISTSQVEVNTATEGRHVMIINNISSV